MDRKEALELLARLHSVQNSFYSDGDEGELRTLLASDTIWHVPVRNLIAALSEAKGHASRKLPLVAPSAAATVSTATAPMPPRAIAASAVLAQSSGESGRDPARA